MRRSSKQSEKDQLSIRNGVWLSMLGMALLGILGISLSRKSTMKDPSEQSFEIASAAQHSSFAKAKRTFDRSVASNFSQEYADEISAIDFSIINDRSHWVDPAHSMWLP